MCRSTTEALSARRSPRSSRGEEVSEGFDKLHKEDLTAADVRQTTTKILLAIFAEGPCEFTHFNLSRDDCLLALGERAGGTFSLELSSMLRFLGATGRDRRDHSSERTNFWILCRFCSIYVRESVRPGDVLIPRSTKSRSEHYIFSGIGITATETSCWTKKNDI